MDHILKRIQNVCFKYTDAIISMGAWSGHCYAPEYLSDETDEMKSILGELKERTKSHSAASALFHIEDDYGQLITKVYQAENLSDTEKHVVADSLNDTFLNKLDECYDVLKEFFENKTGKALEQYLEAET